MDIREDERRLEEPELASALAEVPEWTSDGTAITRAFTLKGWKSAMRFANEIADAAVAADHHPDIHIERYKHVRIVLTTHASKGISRSDIELAKAIDAIHSSAASSSSGSGRSSTSSTVS